VTSHRLIEGWSEQTAGAVAGRHVLALQDTSEIKFNTSDQRTRGLGKVGKGRSRGVLLHAMLAIDAQDGACLGLVGGDIWTRSGRVTVSHSRRELTDKESQRWLDTARCARTVLEQAACITVIADRESDIYAEWVTLPDHQLHLLTRVMHDRALADGGTLYQAADRFSVTDTRTLELRTRAKHAPSSFACASAPSSSSVPAGRASRNYPTPCRSPWSKPSSSIRPIASSQCTGGC
jgi:hypothetical protein